MIDIVKRYWIFLVWIVAWYFSDRFQYTMINNAYLIAFFITIGKLLYDSYDGFFKYKTAQVIMNNAHFSHYGPLISFDRYYLISLGDNPYFFTKASEGWLVVPKSSVVMVGEQIFVNARVQRIPLREAPVNVRNYFRRKGYEGKIYYGEISENEDGIIKLDNIEISSKEVYEFIVAQNKLINTLYDLLRKDSQAIAEYGNLASNLIHSLETRPSAIRELLKRMKKED